MGKQITNSIILLHSFDVFGFIGAYKGLEGKTKKLSKMISTHSTTFIRKKIAKAFLFLVLHHNKLQSMSGLLFKPINQTISITLSQIIATKLYFTSLGFCRTLIANSTTSKYLSIFFIIYIYSE